MCATPFVLWPLGCLSLCSHHVLHDGCRPDFCQKLGGVSGGGEARGAVLSRQGQEAGVAGGRLLECRARATRATPSPCAPPSVGGAGQKPLGLGAPYVTMPAQVPRLQASGVSITAHGQSEAPPPPPRVKGAPRPALRLQGADGTCRVWDSRPRGPRDVASRLETLLRVGRRRHFLSERVTSCHVRRRRGDLVTAHGGRAEPARIGSAPPRAEGGDA